MISVGSISLRGMVMVVRDPAGDFQLVGSQSGGDGVAGAHGRDGRCDVCGGDLDRDLQLLIWAIDAHRCAQIINSGGWARFCYLGYSAEIA